MHKKNNEKGVILILVFIIMITLLFITSGFLYMISAELRGMGFDVTSQKAIWIAEGGLEKYMYLLKTDDDYRANYPDLEEDLGIGSYLVQATYDEGTSIYTLTSTGTAGRMTRQISQSAVTQPDLLDRGIHADGSIVNFDDSIGTINGNISCFVAVANYEGMTINGVVTERYPKVNPSINYDYYAGIADHYSTSPFTFTNATYTGIWYTTKSVTIGDNARIEGTVIAEGSIEFNGKADNVLINPKLFAPDENYPAIVSGASILSTDTGAPPQRIGLQNSTINGLILADNNITFNNMQNNTFNGTILVGGNISMEDGSTFTVSYDSDMFSPMPPGFTFSSGDARIVKQDDWNEIVPAT